MPKFVIEGSRVDIRAAWENPLILPPCVLPGLHRGLIGGLFADGDVGKTFLLLQLAAQIAATASVNLLGFETIHNGKVLYISGEDPKDQLHNRMNAILAPLRGRLDGDQLRDQIEKNLVLVSKEGGGLDIEDQEFFGDFVEEAIGFDLVIIDTLRKFHRRNEDKNSDMMPVMSKLNLAALEARVPLIFSHHVTKSSTRDGVTDQNNAFSGAGVIRTESRYGASMSLMTESEAKKLLDENGKFIPQDMFPQYVKFTTTKGNYGKKPPPCWFKRADNGVLVPVELRSKGEQSANQKPEKPTYSGPRRTKKADVPATATAIESPAAPAIATTTAVEAPVEPDQKRKNRKLTPPAIRPSQKGFVRGKA